MYIPQSDEYLWYSFQKYSSHWVVSQKLTLYEQYGTNPTSGSIFGFLSKFRSRYHRLSGVILVVGRPAQMLRVLRSERDATITRSRAVSVDRDQRWLFSLTASSRSTTVPRSTNGPQDQRCTLAQVATEFTPSFCSLGASFRHNHYIWRCGVYSQRWHFFILGDSCCWWWCHRQFEFLSMGSGG